MCVGGLRADGPGTDPKPSLGQALHRLAGSTYTEKLSKEGGVLRLRRNASDREIIEEFYLAALSRFPTKVELASLESALSQASGKQDSRPRSWRISCGRSSFLRSL